MASESRTSLDPVELGGPWKGPWAYSKENRKVSSSSERREDYDNLAPSPEHCSLPGPIHMLYGPYFQSGAPQCGPTLSQEVHRDDGGLHQASGTETEARMGEFHWGENED